LLNIRGFLKAGPRKNFSFKPVRSARKVADPCYTVILIASPKILVIWVMRKGSGFIRILVKWK